MIATRREAGGLSFEVTVKPRASRVGVEGSREDGLLLRLSAPPVEGEANKQCIEVLAKALGVPKSAVTIVSGLRSRRKRVYVKHGNASHLAAVLSSLESG